MPSIRPTYLRGFRSCAAALAASVPRMTSTFGQRMAIAAIIVGVFGTAAGWAALNRAEAFSAWLFAGAAVPAVAICFSAVRKWAGTPYLLAVTLTIGVAALGTWSLRPNDESQASHVPPPQPSASSAGAFESPDSEPPMRFSPLPSRSVLQCQVYSGEGEIPDGQTLMILDRSVKENDKPEGSRFYLDGKATMNTNGTGGWQTPRIEAGDTHVEIAALLVPTLLFDALSSIDPVGDGTTPDTPWLIGTLPPGQPLVSLFVDPKPKTAKDPSGCA